MTKAHEASRTLVKSPPELWAECSDAGSLARHLGEFGEITITRLEPETTVAWEGEHASGTVRIEPSGWGTRVTLTAASLSDTVEPGELETTVQEESDATLEETLEEPDPALESDTPAFRIRWRRLRTRMRALLRPEAAPDELPEPEAPPAEEPAESVSPTPAADSAPSPPAMESEDHGSPEPSAEPGADAAAILTAALDSLGQAHHRPFSRA